MSFCNEAAKVTCATVYYSLTGALCTTTFLEIHSVHGSPTKIGIPSAYETDPETTNIYIVGDQL